MPWFFSRPPLQIAGPSRVGTGRDLGFDRGGTEREHKGGPPCVRSWTIKVDDCLTPLEPADTGLAID
jgi:hypothetical protein